MLTELEVKKAKAKEKKYKLYDKDYLYLEIYPNNIKKWVYDYKKKKTFSIGKYPDLTLKQARIKRDEIKREILLYGLDEVLAKKHQDKIKNKIVFENVVNEWLKEYSKNKAPRTITSTTLRVNKHILPTFKRKDITTISIKDIYSFLKTLNKPTAEKVKSILNNIFSYAISKEYIKHNIIKDIELKLIFQNKNENNHYSFVTELDEVKAYFKAVKNLNDRVIVKGAIKIIWLTALRQGTTRLIKWEHIDFENKTLFIPKENLKVKSQDILIPLTGEAIATFKELEKYKKDDLVFYSSNNKNQPISETALRKFLKEVSQEQNINYLTLHGIRHIFSTFTRQYIQQEHNIHDEVIEIALQHLDKNKIRAVYNHYDYFQERKQLLNLWSEFLLNL